jgi:hypothetical protein
MKRLALAVASGLTGLLLTAGCGGVSGTADENPPTTPTPSYGTQSPAPTLPSSVSPSSSPG